MNHAHFMIRLTPINTYLIYTWSSVTGTIIYYLLPGRRIFGKSHTKMQFKAISEKCSPAQDMGVSYGYYISILDLCPPFMY